MKAPRPRVPKNLGAIEKALDSGKYEKTPTSVGGYLTENPEKFSQVVKWNPQLMSYEFSDGVMFFCGLLQDAEAKLETTEQGDFTKNEEVEEFGHEA
jgi:hypothetical protein